MRCQRLLPFGAYDHTACCIKGAGRQGDNRLSEVAVLADEVSRNGHVFTATASRDGGFHLIDVLHGALVNLGLRWWIALDGAGLLSGFFGFIFEMCQGRTATGAFYTRCRRRAGDDAQKAGQR